MCLSFRYTSLSNRMMTMIKSNSPTRPPPTYIIHLQGLGRVRVGLHEPRRGLPLLAQELVAGT